MSSTAPALSEIGLANQQFMAAFKRGDAAAVAACYSADARLLPPNSPPVTTTDGIRAFWQAVIQTGIKEATLETVEVEKTGEAGAVEEGRYTLLGATGDVLDTGKYVVIWQKDGGAWKLHRDIWNSSRPAAT